MNPRKKLLVSLSTLAVMSVISVLAIIAVFAASNQALQTSVNVQYLAEGVSATVSASYTVGGTTTKMTSSSGYDSITFAPGPNGGSEDGLSPSGDIVIEDTFIVFKYVFNNTSTASSPIYIVLTAPAGFPIGDNMSDYFAYSYGTSALNLNNSSIGNSGVYEEFEMQVINPGETLNVYVLACVDDDSADASYSGDFTWMMEELDYATHWNLPEEYLKLNSTTGTYYVRIEGEGDATDYAVSTTLIIPSEYSGKPVTELRLSVNTAELNLDTVFIPNSVTEIEMPSGVFRISNAIFEDNNATWTFTNESPYGHDVEQLTTEQLIERFNSGFYVPYLVTIVKN